MSDFGKAPPRSLLSFGVSGLLEEGCHVFYCALFDTHQIGRISDLLCARLRDGVVDELPVRMALLLEIFEAASLAEAGFGEPVMLECGIDREKIAVGVAFHVPEGVAFDFEKFGERIAAGAGEGRFESVASRLRQASDRVYFRFEPKTRRFEAVSLIAIPGKIPDDQRAGEPQFVLIAESAESGHAPQAASYTELGDLDYVKLLEQREAAGEKKAKAKAVGEAIAAAANVTEEPKETIRGKAKDADGFKKKFSSSPTEEDRTEIRFKGGKPGEGGDADEASGGNPDLEVVDRNVSGADGEVFKTTARGSTAEVEELQRKIAELEARAQAAEDAVTVRGSGSGVDAAIAEIEGRGEGDDDSLLGKIKRRLFGKKAKSRAEDPIVVEAEPGLDSDEEAKTTVEAPEESPASESDEKEQKGAKDPEAVDPADGDESADEVAKKIVTASGALEKVLVSAKEEAEEQKIAKGDEKAKRWMDGLMSDLVAEKAKIQEVAKKLDLSVRRRELEFRNKERAMQDELRKKEELLKQRQSALMRAKEQTNQVQAALQKERELRTASNEDGTKQKYATAQKLLSSAKQENADLNRKLDDLRSQVVVLKTRPSGSSAELGAIKTKYERSQKQVDELKRTNQQLLEKLNHARKGGEGGGGSPEDTRRRLESATKMATQYQKEAGDLQRKLDESKADQLRMKRELELANRALKDAQKAAAKKGEAA